ncbi:hypothetical protein EVAR_98220_1 [Eumeta japonica]|uniref:Uncharacterized protein n=1 Tax=Eumeta variegata TaxID=151549 RepID=A0A4C1Y562_EUMVA|nr:hypothetical protein EVAR_98220_1 [Eumeta japonica]
MESSRSGRAAAVIHALSSFSRTTVQNGYMSLADAGACRAVGHRSAAAEADARAPSCLRRGIDYFYWTY